MEEALQEAALSLPGDVPVGAVVVRDGRIIARAHNVREAEHSPTGHAEMRALEAAAQAIGDWRLNECDVYVTLEPCPMCAGAISSARCRRLYFGAYDPEAGAAGSRFNLFDRGTELYPLICEAEASALLSRFFGDLRQKTDTGTDPYSKKYMEENDGAEMEKTEKIEKIASFTVDHRYIVPGMYISRIDGDVTTFDLRTRRPNTGDLMSNAAMHSVEHMFATYIRNSAIGPRVIYFGPMGCQTGFYLLVRGIGGEPPEPEEVLTATKDTLRKIIEHRGDVFGKSEIECGNYRNLDIDPAKAEAARFLGVLESAEVTFRYGTGPDADKNK